jgi:H+/Cl- antiporter ClcA
MTTTHTPPKTSSNEKVKTFPKGITRILYIFFTTTGILYWIFGSDKSDAFVKLGIALLFDPFNPSQPYGQRPLYQKVWLFVHLGLVLGGFGWVVFK